MSASGETTGSTERCGKWMPRARAYCGRAPGHTEGCRSVEAMEAMRQRTANRPRQVVTPEARRRWNQTYRLHRYGLTLEDFDGMLEFQGHACGMCREKFQDGQVICVDHDHACHPEEKQACKKCVRGLLCKDCNTALGHIERRYEMARTYLDTRAGLVEFLLFTGD